MSDNLTIEHAHAEMVAFQLLFVDGVKQPIADIDLAANLLAQFVDTVCDKLSEDGQREDSKALWTSFMGVAGSWDMCKEDLQLVPGSSSQ